jgi:hypothetical protein
MARHPVDLGFRTFKTKSEAGDHFKAILNAYDPGDTLSDAHAAEVEALLARHSEYEDKVGEGIRSFGVRAALYGTRCFEIRRVDGTATDFSYGNCIGGAPSSRTEIMRAMRMEVQSDILDAKEAFFKANADADGTVVCVLSKARISRSEAHADHAPPHTFRTLADLFLKARKIVPGPEHVTPSRDNQYAPRLVDPELAADWRAFHHENASIRVVRKHENLRTNAVGKPKKADRQLSLL